MASTLAWIAAGTANLEWNLTMSAGQTGPGADVALDRLGEAALVEACLAGRAEAFDLIVERHRRDVYRLCYRFVPNHEDASDLSQEVFLRAFRALKKFRGQASLGTWLYRIGVNVCLNRLSQKVPRNEPLDEQAHVDTRSESPSDRLMRGEREGRVRLAVAQLPPRQRAALILRVYKELSHQEIAAALGTSVGAAKANVFHALRNLKRLLGGEEG